MLNARIHGGGVAVWGKAIPTSKGLSSFTYETEGTLKLSIDGKAPAYFYVYMTGLDNIDTEGTVQDGFGNATFTDIDGDNIHLCSSIGHSIYVPLFFHIAYHNRR